MCSEAFAKSLKLQGLSPGYPRLVIPQQLSQLSSAKMRPATLFLYGLMHTIALDGTADDTFASNVVPRQLLI